jgi:diaminopimelate epimerase
MQLRFTKMQGLGNDFMVVRANGDPVPGPSVLARLADRRTGVGFDQLLWLETPREDRADVRYRIFNSDGSEAEQCGNGARCIVRLLAAGSDQSEFLLEHAGGTSRGRVEPGGLVAVDMGAPDFRPAALPFIVDAEAPAYAIDAGGDRVEIRIVSMGNPHAVLVVNDVDTAPVARLGPLLERHERFPNRANIGFMQVVAPDRIRLRVFERGAGETRACGTGACAAAVVGRRAGFLNDTVHVQLPGGEVIVRWEGPGQPVWLTGEAETVFEGIVEL